MKSTVLPFALGAFMVLGICCLKTNKSKIENLMKDMKECGNKIMKEFKVSKDGCCNQSGCDC
ncbi:MAG: hypothetical protein IKC22_03150 [Bacilli bacterium]|nr:hypothetical protein [Bacilli bacterium]